MRHIDIVYANLIGIMRPRVWEKEKEKKKDIMITIRDDDVSRVSIMQPLTIRWRNRTRTQDLKR